jgi:hypothetical protein
MRTFIGLAVTFTLLASQHPATAGLGRSCRKLCKPMIASCVAAGERRRACNRTFLPRCRREGLEVCSTTTTTTPAGAGTDITTTTLPAGGTDTTTTTLPKAPGFLGFYIDEIQRDDGSDPGTFHFLAWLKGSATSVPVDLDPAHFYVLDAVGGRFDALPAAEPGDCTAAMTTMPEVEVICWVRLVMPLSTGLVPYGGDSIAALHFDGGGYQTKVSFRIYDGGGYGVGG